MIYIEPATDANEVKQIVDSTINEIYPHYYAKGAVDFFLKLHSPDNIQKDIDDKKVYIIFDGGETAGTVTINGDEISRLFVLPEFQRKGCGRAALDYAESIILKSYERVILHASLSAKTIYLKRGYKEIEYRVGKMENGDFLCVDIMEKRK